MTRLVLSAATVIALAIATTARADCASDTEIDAFVASFTARTPAKALGAGGSMEDALCTQAKLTAALSQSMGPVVGYKAGLTSKPAQDRFGTTEPVRGVLYRDMLLPDGATVSAQFGTIPLLEADLLLVVGDGAINHATTPESAIVHIASVRPFIELPDLALAKGEAITGETITAMGVGARLGVMGADIPVTDPATMLAALGNMTVTVRAADGSVMAEAPGKAVLGNPVNSVLWLMSKGITLKPGDLISVGSFGPLLSPAKTGGAATVSYDGLPGNPTVSVSFTD